MEINRRSFLVAGTTVAVGAGIAGATRNVRQGDVQKGSATIVEPFYGQHQPGIATPQQEHALWCAFSVKSSSDRASIQRLLRLWSNDSALLMSGNPTMGDAEAELSRIATGLTITFGFGYSLFTKLGIESTWPLEVSELPDFATDKLLKEWTGGDIVVQICGNDRLRVHHAMRELVRDAKPFASVAWQQSGFLPSTELANGQTSRNLFGQKDGTGNFPPKSEDFATTVWTAGTARTTMVIRRIRMNIDKWELLTPIQKGKVIGRDLETGAPLSGGDERSEPDFAATDHHGLVIPVDAHFRRARLSQAKLHRRGYSYQSDTTNYDEIDQGLMFVSFQADPASFIKIQQNLASMDSLNTWTTAVGSGLFVVPEGCAEGGWIGDQLV